ncbi:MULTISPECIES: hypothetical protein [Vibrio harveyi group]|uniref:hypothetical protein n=1 Tax=Vibrio harveyi group TaxID=717610 RepID=UPI00038E3406|nr:MULTISPECIES: hypothetical protein [Vibrio harveyi group]EJG1934663.1 hypothetical protein [Vibrio parahaemolyticus]EQM10843.1 hypothetical protein D045_3377 [Vibrio parahaemolyticus VP-NY4]MCW7954316.1 hypothetical protein [Vibrio parahaemolyticus]MCW7964541.1 hypothetical protein [Vibrio parahaemolyticus]MCW7980831.1 hypothetical protein [Vibrio parahaemolyticus]
MTATSIIEWILSYNGYLSVPQTVVLYVVLSVYVNHYETKAKEKAKKATRQRLQMQELFVKNVLDHVLTNHSKVMIDHGVNAASRRMILTAIMCGHLFK